MSDTGSDDSRAQSRSRNPTALREELDSIDYSGDDRVLTELRAEARETVDAQQATLDDIDTKASRILRLNIVLIGILVSGVSIAAQTGGSDSGFDALAQYVNVYVGTGVVALILSTAFAAMTYTASELDVGVSSDNLTTLLGADFSRREAESLLVKNYVVRINFNRSVNVRNIPLIQATILLVVVAVTSLSLGVYEGAIGPVPWYITLLTAVFLIVLVVVSGIVSQSIRAVRDFLEWR
jgi:hypothetical protein